MTVDVDPPTAPAPPQTILVSASIARVAAEAVTIAGVVEGACQVVTATYPHLSQKWNGIIGGIALVATLVVRYGSEVVATKSAAKKVGVRK